MACTVSSRTWGGGEPRRCPICRALSWVEPSLTVGDAPCPGCGHLLWPAHRVRQRIASALRPRAGTAFRVGRALKHAVRRIRGAVAAVRSSARRPKPTSPAPSTGGVWDAWLDA